MDDEVLDPKEIDDTEEEDDLDSGPAKKRKKESSEEDLLSDEPESLDELLDNELGEEDEPYDDVDKW